MKAEILTIFVISFPLLVQSNPALHRGAIPSHIKFFTRLFLPQVYQSHLTLISESEYCLQRLPQFHPNFKLRAPVSIVIIPRSPNFRNYTTAYHFTHIHAQKAIKNKEAQLQSPFYSAILDQVVFLTFQDLIEPILFDLRNKLHWNPHAHYFIFPQCTRTRKSKFDYRESKSIFETLYKYDIYKAVLVLEGSFARYYPNNPPTSQIIVVPMRTASSWEKIFPRPCRHLPNKFKVGTFNYPPFSFMDDFNRWKGIEIIILNTMRERMNFSYEIVPVDESIGWGERDGCSGNWTGLMSLITNREVDFGFGAFYPLGDRLGLVERTSLYDLEELCWAVPQKYPGAHDWLSLVHPFSIQVWAILGITCLGAWVIMVLMDSLSTSRRRQVDAWVHLVGVFLYQRYPSGTKIPGVFWVIWSFLGLCLLCMYQGQLISNITFPEKTYPINTVQELEETDIEVFGEGEYKSLLQHTSLHDRFIDSDLTNQILHRIVMKQDAALLADRKHSMYLTTSTYKMVGGFPPVHISSECITFYQLGYVFPINSKYTSEFDKYMQRLFEGGLPKVWLRTLLRRSIYDTNFHLDDDDDGADIKVIKHETGRKKKLEGTTENHESDTADIISLKIIHFREAFLVLMTGHCIAVGVFLGEIFLGATPIHELT
ncbi:unnamed protein product [Allacma fusca]|uniref:Ionotropic glutamate receptor L-glutamate and glycine-binding domain-containing protein n=1 Tax=Allacma fusca TaxID=39272 RepID=A0A8J2JU72_9HEXA|nr:unnamed protein product [Allacma fusca]